MSKFTLTISSTHMAAQIANLLNIGGQLWNFMTAYSIIYGPTKYIVELDREKVIGVIGLEEHGKNVTELKHLCVHPDYRRTGLGKKLLAKGVEASKTKFVYGTVRSDNHTNIRNNLRVGMIPIGKKRSRNYHIIIFARRKNSECTIQKRLT